MNSEIYKKIVEKEGTPTFIYSESILKRNIKNIKEAISFSKIDNKINIYAAYFTTSNPHLFKIVSDNGTGITLQTSEELYQLEKFGLENIESIVSPTSLSEDELRFFIDKGLYVNVASLEELEYALINAKKVGLRIDLSRNQNQRTGIKINELKLVKKICDKHHKEIYGIHSYYGTGSNFNKLIEQAKRAFRIHKKYFPHLKEINLGGGFAFDYRTKDPDKKHFCWKEYFLKLKELVKKYDISKEIIISIEPGRDIFADVGEFIIKINRIQKSKRDNFYKIYVDGSYVFIPSAMIKKRKHQVVFLDRHFKEIIIRNSKAKLCGCTTLSSDYLLPGLVDSPPNLEEGNYIIIKDVGAYGACQHMEFLNKRPASEILIKEFKDIELISKRGDYADKVRNVPLNPEKL